MDALLHFETACQALGTLPLQREGDAWCCQPNTAEQVAQLLSAAREAKLPVAIMGEQTLPPGPHLVVDMTGLHRIRQYTPADRVITVETGITIRALNQILHAEGHALPLFYPPEATLLDILAEDRPSFETGLHGLAFRNRPRDLVLGLEVATLDGELTHSGGQVVKNVAGYDLKHLYLGSTHALGVITAVTLALTSQPETTAYHGVGFPTLEAALAFVQPLITTPPPTLSCCELYSAGRLPNALSERSAASARAWTLLLGFSGEKPLVEANVREALPSEADVFPVKVQSAVAWKTALSGWPEADLVLECAFAAGELASVWQAIQTTLKATTWEFQSQWRPAAGLCFLSGPPDRIPVSLLAVLQQTLHRHGGHLCIPQGPPDWMAQANLPADAVLQQLMARLKHSFDPEGLLWSPRLPLGRPLTLPVPEASHG